MSQTPDVDKGMEGKVLVLDRVWFVCLMHELRWGFLFIIFLSQYFTFWVTVRVRGKCKNWQAPAVDETAGRKIEKILTIERTGLFVAFFCCGRNQGRWHRCFSSRGLVASCMNNFFCKVKEKWCLYMTDYLVVFHMGNRKEQNGPFYFFYLFYLYTAFWIWIAGKLLVWWDRKIDRWR